MLWPRYGSVNAAAVGSRSLFEYEVYLSFAFLCFIYLLVVCNLRKKCICYVFGHLRCRQPAVRGGRLVRQRRLQRDRVGGGGGVVRRQTAASRGGQLRRRRGGETGRGLLLLPHVVLLLRCGLDAAGGSGSRAQSAGGGRCGCQVVQSRVESVKAIGHQGICGQERVVWIVHCAALREHKNLLADEIEVSF